MIKMLRCKDDDAIHQYDTAHGYFNQLLYARFVYLGPRCGKKMNSLLWMCKSISIN